MCAWIAALVVNRLNRMTQALIGTVRALVVETTRVHANVSTNGTMRHCCHLWFVEQLDSTVCSQLCCLRTATDLNHPQNSCVVSCYVSLDVTKIKLLYCFILIVQGMALA